MNPTTNVFFRHCGPGFLALTLCITGCERAATDSGVNPQTDLRRDATVAAAEKVVPSVVNIATSARAGFEKKLLRIGPFVSAIVTPKGERLNSIGSGIILEQVGDEVYILTNFHVVNDASSTEALPPRIHVQLVGGEVYEAQRLVWTTQKDLALLKITVEHGKRVQGVRFAKDDDLLLGETVIAVGNPLGLGGSVSRGILSSKNRRTSSGDNQLDLPDLLQTDADINPGNSGGPLVNLNGEVIGINAAILEDKGGSGVKFAIPVKQISYAISGFFSLEFTSDIWLGAIFSGTQTPLTVRFVQRGGPADRAGLKEGQQILEVNGEPVTGLVKFNTLLASSANRRARITVADGGRQRYADVQLVPLVELMKHLLTTKLGIASGELPATTATSAFLKTTDGVLVTGVADDSVAARAGLKPGMIITELNGEPLGRHLAAASQSLGNTKPGAMVNLTVFVPQTSGTNGVSYKPAGLALPSM